ncbi:phage tail protein [Xenorhabdus griffiniae]|uniref:Phage tail protein n=1 Tax=Xenorhabdus griffiniae TaxID=351672 RepID=A0ABY9XLH2_9GAMM|nr:phage tail protein [Xenorhabdus griffiniae]MBD1229330.1 phage tail protein [Xenorhabdus griffiniae]MBE8588440.1 phage tail protein [Xenorhabdus griffiniae]WMV73627.1 phage tail protein [Xenorhabdus griffiniae]WNH03307.1 phage tail protein [Xenorhabdus griffiniae]
MSKLQRLTAFLRENLPARICETEFTSEMDEIRFIPAQRDLGLGQYQMFVQQYEAVIAWGRFPYRECDPRNIPLLIDSWLTAQGNGFGDANVEQEQPTLTVEVDDNTAVVVVSLSLAEPVVIREDPHGMIPFDGKRWSLADTEVWFAEQGAVHSVDETGAQIGEHSA